MQLYLILRRYVGNDYQWTLVRTVCGDAATYVEEVEARTEYERLVAQEERTRRDCEGPHALYERMESDIVYRLVSTPLALLEESRAPHSAPVGTHDGRAAGTPEAARNGAPADP
jgi:hypothetical protein